MRGHMKTSICNVCGGTWGHYPNCPRFICVLFGVIMLACSSQQLPPEACTPLKQRAYLAACERAIALECETRGEPCADKLVCIDALKEVCPQPMCPNEASPKEVTP